MALLSRKSSILWAERKADPPTRRVAERRALNRLLRGGNADRCPVCWDTFADIEADGARQVVAAPCGHRFCAACLREAMATACMCPLCKSTRGMRRFAGARGWRCAEAEDVVYVETEEYTYATYPSILRQAVAACNRLERDGFEVKQVLVQTATSFVALLPVTRTHIYYGVGQAGREIGCEYLGRVDAGTLPRALQRRMGAILAELPDAARVLNVNHDGESGRWTLFYATPACADGSRMGCDLDAVGGCCGGREPELPAAGRE